MIPALRLKKEAVADGSFRYLEISPEKAALDNSPLFQMKVPRKLSKAEICTLVVALREDDGFLPNEKTGIIALLESLCLSAFAIIEEKEDCDAEIMVLKRGKNTKELVVTKRKDTT